MAVRRKGRGRGGTIRVNRSWVYIVVGAAMVAGGLALLSRLQDEDEFLEDPIAEARRMLSRAQTKVSEIEAGLQSSRQSAPQGA